MQTGEIKFFNTEKGFGFIKNLESGEEIFVHISDVADSDKDKLTEWVRVQYTEVEGRRGMQASEVTVLEDLAEAA